MNQWCNIIVYTDKVWEAVYKGIEMLLYKIVMQRIVYTNELWLVCLEAYFRILPRALDFPGQALGITKLLNLLTFYFLFVKKKLLYDSNYGTT